MNIQKNKKNNIFNNETALLIFWTLVLSSLNLNSVALNDFNTIYDKIDFKLLDQIIKNNENIDFTDDVKKILKLFYLALTMVLNTLIL